MGRKSARSVVCVKLSLARFGAQLHAGSEGISTEQAPQPSETIEALRNGDGILERAQCEVFFLPAR